MKEFKERDVLDMLTPEQVAVIDSHGYSFLAEHGYNVKGVERSAKKRRKLKAALRAKSQTLEYALYNGAVQGVMTLIFYLKGADGEVLGRSSGIKLVFKYADRGEIDVGN